MFCEATVATPVLEKNHVPVERKPKVRLGNPGLVFETALRQLDDAFIRLEEECGATFTDFEDYLKKEAPHVMNTLEKMMSNIDCDIYGQFRKGTLTVQVFTSWKNQVEEWKIKILLAVRDFKIEQFSASVIEVPMSN